MRRGAFVILSLIGVGSGRLFAAQRGSSSWVLSWVRALSWVLGEFPGLVSWVPYDYVLGPLAYLINGDLSLS